MKEHIDAGKTKKQAFDVTARSGPIEYGKAFARLCSDAHTSRKNKNHVIFLDKNHPINGIKRAVDDIKKNLKGNIIVKKLYLIPEVPSDKTSRLAELPFSENFIFQMYAWGQQRTDHETLDNSDPHNMIEIQTMFLKMARGVVFDDGFLVKHELDGFLRVPMSVETFEVPTPLINAFRAMMNTFSGVGQEGNTNSNYAFLKELRKSNDVLL